MRWRRCRGVRTVPGQKNTCSRLCREQVFFCPGTVRTRAIVVGPMSDVLHSAAKPSSTEFRENREHHLRTIGEIQSHVAAAKLGGGEEACARHHKRGKLLPRERIDAILDPGAPFLELSSLAAHGLYDGAAPSAGVVTGVGLVEGREVMIVANDATVKGGTYFPMTVKKHVRA